MSLGTEIHCPECQELVKDVDSLDAGECPWCGAFLVNVYLKSNNSNTSKTKVEPGLFDDITVSDDESLAVRKPSNAKHSREAMKDEFSLEDILSQFKQEQKGKPSTKARSKRKQAIMSDSSDEEWIAPTPSKKKKREGGKKQKAESLYDTDEDWDAMGHTSNIKKRYSTSFSSASDSDYLQSDSEDESLLKKSKYTQKETKATAKAVDPVRKVVVKINRPKAETTPTRSLYKPSSSSSTASSSSTTPGTASKGNRIHSFVIFNAEMRGKLAKENRDLSPKDLSRLVSGLWNKLSKEQKAVYANKSLGPKRAKPPCGNGYVLFKNEQFSLVQKEFKFKGPTAMNSASSIIGVRWKNLDPKIKETYNLRAKKMREDWAFEHPREYEAYMDGMKAKISETKRANRKTKS